MYNRYVPQADGSYRRSRVPERTPEPRRPAPPPADCPPKPEQPCPPPQQNPCPPGNRPPRREHRPEPQGGNVLGFLRNLLPQNFDTGDLFVVMLLLLMSENCKENQNTALLTLVIYLFL